MEIESKEYQVYKNIDFVQRYESLSQANQFDERLEYSKEKVIELINGLGFKSRYVSSDNFFKTQENIRGIKFYFHQCLKYSNVELIIGAVKVETDELIAGSVFGRIYRLFKYAEGIEIENNIKKPKFRNYGDLEEILREAFSIYEDFKVEVLELFVGVDMKQEEEHQEEEPKTALEIKLEAFVEELKAKGYPSHEYFSEIREELREKETKGKQRLKSSFAITQYANFTRDLEEKLKDIISLT